MIINLFIIFAIIIIINFDLSYFIKILMFNLLITISIDFQYFILILINDFSI